jgi:hypothetical protein
MGSVTTSFDAMWFGDANYPLGESVFTTLLASGRDHVVVMPTTRRREQVSAGHDYGQYDTRLARANTRWRQVDPTQLAQQVADDHAKWEFGSPWVFCNELSYTQWRTSANEEYRVWAVTFAQALADAGLTPAVYSPIQGPLGESDNWSALAAAGYVAIEGYVDPSAVVGAADPADYCEGLYTSVASRYEAQGVPIDRCVLVEHYAQTLAGTGRGRGGLDLQSWLSVIGARIAGARAAGFTFLGSYAWGYNQMDAPEDELIATANAYVDATA